MALQRGVYETTLFVYSFVVMVHIHRLGERKAAKNSRERKTLKPCVMSACRDVLDTSHNTQLFVVEREQWRVTSFGALKAKFHK